MRLVRGFTLVELLITVAVTAVLLAIAVPNLSSLFEKNRVKGIAEEFAASIRVARSEALLANRTMFLTINLGDSATPWCWGISDTTASCNCNTLDACTVRGQDRHTTGNDLARISISASPPGFINNTISSQGIFNTSGQIDFQSGATLARVKVNLVGGTRTCSDALGGWTTLANC